MQKVSNFMHTFMEHFRLRFLPQPFGASIRSMSRRSPSARGTIATTSWNKTREQSTSSTERVQLRQKLSLEEAPRERLQWAPSAVAVPNCPYLGDSPWCSQRYSGASG